VKYRHIVVEGAIGCGKTSLATRLAERLGAGTILEDPKANPFLPQFYRDMRRYALPTQLFFLFQRVQQLEALSPTLRSSRISRWRRIRCSPASPSTTPSTSSTGRSSST
jgi:deoxyadenosine/deoxycytidine kinase